VQKGVRQRSNRSGNQQYACDSDDAHTYTCRYPYSCHAIASRFSDGVCAGTFHSACEAKSLRSQYARFRRAGPRRRS